MPAADDSKRKAARETIDILHEISTLLNTHLDRQSLSYCVSLIENGVNPEALAVSTLTDVSTTRILKEAGTDKHDR
ncbi:hypothetical protein LTR50_000061 [Elasticomyces elasticus]|nr:hypothetical protein LTR50_000061 [Elasticomyces elasticus]